MRPVVVGMLATALLATGCASHPAVDLGFGTLDGKLEVRVYGVGFGNSVEVCGVGKKKGSAFEVPYECALPLDMDLAAPEAIESKPIVVTVKPIVGAAQTVEKTVKLDVVKQLQLIESWLSAASRGTPLPRGKKKSGKPGIAFVGSGFARAIDAKTVGDVDIVVRATRVNDRDTGKTCAYTGVMTGVLHAYDLDLEAFDAHTGKSLGKTRIENDSPGCPSTNYGKVGSKNTVSSGPSDHLLNKWARTLAPDDADD